MASSSSAPGPSRPRPLSRSAISTHSTTSGPPPADLSELRVVVVERGAHGFGFNLKGLLQFGGAMQAVNGHLYPPLQYVSVVHPDGPAASAGLKEGDRIFEVNGRNAQGVAHSAVVEWVYRTPRRLTLKVMSVSEVEAARLLRVEESAIEEMSSRRPKAPIGAAVISICGHKEVYNTAKPFTVFHIYVNGKYCCSRRYREFDLLNKQLKERFPWFHFPPLPGKKLNGFRSTVLKEKAAQERQEKLVFYLTTVFSAEDLFNCEASRRFLTPTVRPDGVPEDEPRPTHTHTHTHMANPHAGANEASSAHAATTATSTTSPATTTATVKSSSLPTSTSLSASSFARGKTAPGPSPALHPPTLPKSLSVGTSSLLPLGTPAYARLSSSSTQLNLPHSSRSHSFLTSPSVSRSPSPLPFDRERASTPSLFNDIRPAPSCSHPALDFGGKITLAVSLANQRLIGLSVLPTTTIKEVEQMAAKEAGLGAGARLFGLFDMSRTIPCKLPSNQLAAETKGKLALRRWLFTAAEEERVEDQGGDELLAIEAYEALCAGHLGNVETKDMAAFAALHAKRNWRKLLRAARKLDLYGTCIFPECCSDFPEKDTLVLVSISIGGLVLTIAETREATEFPWETIRTFECEGNILRIAYETEEDEEETIELDSPYASSMEACIARVVEELRWTSQLAEGGGPKDEENWFSLPPRK